MIKLKAENDNFSKHIITLLSGNLFAQAIPFLFSPIISRIFLPVNFSSYGVFTSIVSILGGICFFRYEQSILISKTEIEAKNNFILSIVVLSFFSILIVSVIVIIPENILEEWFGLGSLLCFVPVVVLINGIYFALVNYRINLGSYNVVAFSKVVKSIMQSVFQLIFGFVGILSGFGLSYGYGVGLLISLPSLFGKDLKRFSFSKKDIWVFLKKYRRFPLFFFPGTLVNMLALNLTTILINNLYSPENVGFYSFSIRYLGIPLVLVGDAIQKVYIRQAMNEHIKKGQTKDTFISVFRVLVLVLPFFALFFIFAPWGFKLLFGNAWAPAGYVARIVLPIYVMNFLYSPISGVIIIRKKEKSFLFLQLGLLFSSLAPYVVAKYSILSFTSYLFVYSLLMSGAYFLMLIYCIVINLRLNKEMNKNGNK